MSEFENYIRDLLAEEPVRRLSSIPCHRGGNFMEHSIFVSYLSYRICKKLGWDDFAAARGALLHDLFLYDWRDGTHEGRHGLTHPAVACRNAEELCRTREYLADLTELEKDIILRHMWPLTPIRPGYRESFVVCIADKLCAAAEATKLYRRMAVSSAISIMSVNAV
ncbi:MAG: HDIG domain-containing protein [Clostridiales Family XIII bacterium]|jgi:uncharacterized protein|nr:HDIG domain-containing protein [Clostridiales Family XIII bacterium]